MMLPVALVGFACLVVAIVVVVALVAWHPHAHEEATGDNGGVDPATVADWCEHIERIKHPNGGSTLVHCYATPTHEIVGDVTTHGSAGGHSAMVATYCAEHAPEGAVRVRTLASR